MITGIWVVRSFNSLFPHAVGISVRNKCARHSGPILRRGGPYLRRRPFAVGGAVPGVGAGRGRVGGVTRRRRGPAAPVRIRNAGVTAPVLGELPLVAFRSPLSSISGIPFRNSFPIPERWPGMRVDVRVEARGMPVARAELRRRGSGPVSFRLDSARFADVPVRPPGSGRPGDDFHTRGTAPVIRGHRNGRPDPVGPDAGARPAPKLKITVWVTSPEGGGER